MRQRIRIATPSVNDCIRDKTNAKMEVSSCLGHLTVVAKQLTPLHTLTCVDNEVLQARVERLAPWVGDADEAAIPFAVIADCGYDAAICRDDSFTGYHFKVDAIVSEERLGAYDKAAVVLWAGPPLLDDTPPAFKWRRQVDAFRFETPVLDCTLNKVERHGLGVVLALIRSVARLQACP